MTDKDDIVNSLYVHIGILKGVTCVIRAIGLIYVLIVHVLRICGETLISKVILSKVKPTNGK